MIKAKFKQDGEPDLMLFGLSQLNLDKLKEGKPIRIFGKEIGLDVDIAIVYGETEQHIVDDLKKHVPFIDTVVHKSKEDEHAPG